MGDDINRGDESDRLVVVWSTSDPTPSRTPSPDLDHSASLLAGPDGDPAYLSVGDERERWVRVPHDIVALRGSDSAAATAWRHLVREAMEDAFAHGLVATGVSRDDWYRFTPRDTSTVAGEDNS